MFDKILKKITIADQQAKQELQNQKDLIAIKSNVRLYEEKGLKAQEILNKLKKVTIL